MTDEQLAAIRAILEAYQIHTGDEGDCFRRDVEAVVDNDTLALLAEIDRLREVEAEYNADHDSYVETVRLWGRTVKQAHELGADVIAPFQAIRWMVAEINRLRAENEQLRSAWRKPIEYTSGETVPYKGPPIQSYTASEAAEFAGWERLSDEALANFEVQA